MNLLQITAAPEFAAGVFDAMQQYEYTAPLSGRALVEVSGYALGAACTWLGIDVPPITPTGYAVADAATVYILEVQP